MNDVDVLIPTLRRPEHLARALRSVFAQEGGPELMATIVVVDNSPEGSARETVDALRSASPVPLVLVYEPTPGVATARNAGVAASRAPLVAFLDDDEEAPPGWLTTLRAAHLQLGAPVTFGPIRGVAHDARPEFRSYLDRFFSREGGPRTERIEHFFGCGNTIMTRSATLATPAPFDACADQLGGEDDRLFARLKADGASFGWAAQAFVYEHAPAHRARVRYTLKRAFCYGQSPSQTAFRTRDWPGVAHSMIVGAAQAGGYGVMALALLLSGRRGAAVGFLDRACRGAGKVLWGFRIELYGLAVASETMRPAIHPNRRLKQAA